METEIIEKQNEKSLHTEQMQDIIGKPPSWLFRWGISLIFAVTAICIYIASQVSYPELLQTQIKLHALSQPYRVVIKNTSKLLSIRKNNDGFVNKGDSLAILETSKGDTTLLAPVSGKLSYAGIIHVNEQLKFGQIVFLISDPQGGFYGEINIPEAALKNVRQGQTVLLDSEQSFQKNNDLVKGTIKYITADPIKETFYLAEVDFDRANISKSADYRLFQNIRTVNADIVIANSTLLNRIVKSLTRSIK